MTYMKDKRRELRDTATTLTRYQAENEIRVKQPNYKPGGLTTSNLNTMARMLAVKQQGWRKTTEMFIRTQADREISGNVRGIMRWHLELDRMHKTAMDCLEYFHQQNVTGKTRWPKQKKQKPEITECLIEGDLYSTFFGRRREEVEGWQMGLEALFEKLANTYHAHFPQQGHQQNNTKTGLLVPWKPTRRHQAAGGQETRPMEARSNETHLLKQALADLRQERIKQVGSLYNTIIWHGGITGEQWKKGLAWLLTKLVITYNKFFKKKRGCQLLQWNTPKDAPKKGKSHRNRKEAGQAQENSDEHSQPLTASRVDKNTQVADRDAISEIDWGAGRKPNTQEVGRK
jgi:hypothetical protein